MRVLPMHPYPVIVPCFNICTDVQRECKYMASVIYAHKTPWNYSYAFSQDYLHNYLMYTQLLRTATGQKQIYHQCYKNCTTIASYFPILVTLIIICFLKHVSYLHVCMYIVITLALDPGLRCKVMFSGYLLLVTL